MGEAALYNVDGGVATITLNRPDKLNSFNWEMFADVQDGFKQAARDRAVRAVILTGAGRGFCAGQDLTAVKPNLLLSQLLEKGWNAVVRQIRSLEKPVIAAVHGAVAGAGANLALSCDLIVAAEGAYFLQAFVKIGLIPDSGGTFFLPRHVPWQKAMELVALGDKWDVREMAALGVVNRVVPADEMLPAANALASRLASMPTMAIGLAKRAMNRALQTDLNAALDYEGLLQDVAGASYDYKEGVQAFIEKRAPQFKGE